jgi:UDP-glucose 4-epimerase
MGFIGLHTARRLLDVGEDVVITRHSAWREPSFIKDEYGKRVMHERLDITSTYDVMELARKYPLTGIIHLAVPGLSALSPAEDNRVNMVGLLNALEAGKAAGVKRILLASSIGAYSSLVADRPFHEDMTLPATSRIPTEAFKKAFEILGLHWGDRTGIEVVPVRINVNYGPLYHSMGQPNSRMAHAAARGKEPDWTGGASAGQPPYEEDSVDLNYVKDCGLGLQLLMTAEKLNHRIYNLGHGSLTYYKDILAAISEVVPDHKIRLQAGARPAGVIPDGRRGNYLDISRISEDVGFKPEWTIEAGMAEYVEWLRHNDT